MMTAAIIAHFSDHCFTSPTVVPIQGAASAIDTAEPPTASDRMPTTKGPVPRPMMFRMKNSTADDIARIEAGTRWWVIASDGPRYIAASVMPGK